MKILISIFLNLVLGFSLQAQDAFTDVTTAAGILPTIGAEGVAVGDFNNDGYADFYVSFPNEKNHLYKNLGDGTFVEIAEDLGMALEIDSDSRTAVWGDLNNDGWQDLYVGNKGEADQLFLNNGDQTFTETSFAAGIYQQGHPKSVNLADVNNDGWLDIYVVNFAYENVLYLNDGNTENLTFTNYTFAAEALDTGASMGAIFFDYDKDGDVDLYLVHDQNEPNFLYQNDGTGAFTEVAATAGANTASFGMGVTIGDINNDGWLDIYLTNLWANILLLNNADGTFSNISEAANVQDLGMGWGTTFLDYDNDGWMDIYVANDFSFTPSFPYYNVLYRNQGDLTFAIAEAGEAVSNTQNSYGTAILDYNLDGNMDILVANKGDEMGVQLLKNADRPQHWVGLKLVGTESNRDAVGAKIRVTDNLGNTFYRELTAGCSWSSQNTVLQNIGIGSATSVENIFVSWPSGNIEAFDIAEIDQFYTITEGGNIENGLNNGGATNTTFIENQNLQLSIYPNPTDGDFQIEWTTNHNSTVFIDIFNSLGQRVFYQEIKQPNRGNNLFSIQNLDLPAGLYGIRLTQEQDFPLNFIDIK